MPFFSVIVPVYDQWSLVPGLLKALTDQAFPQQGFEVLLVNNGPVFPFDAAVFSDLPVFPDFPAFPDWVRVVDCAKPGSYAARNVGVQAATGDWLVFTDADCVPDAGWLLGLKQAIDAAGGEVGGEVGEAVFFAGGIRMQASECPNVFEVYDLLRGIPQGRYVKSGYAVTANLCVHRAAAGALPFNEGRFSGGDAEFSRALVARGLALQYVPGAFVGHPARDSWLAISTKVRRIKGGQVLSGGFSDRLRWCVRSVLPPVRAFYRYLGQRDFALRLRLLACAVELRLWWVGVDEMLRLLLTNKQPERR